MYCQMKVFVCLTLRSLTSAYNYFSRRVQFLM